LDQFEVEIDLNGNPEQLADIRVNHCMHFVFLYETLSGLGGTEVLIARMSRWLVEEGHSVSLVVESDGVERRLIHPSVRIVVLGSSFKKLGRIKFVREIFAKEGIERPDVVKSFTSFGAWCATTISDAFVPHSRAIHGFYYPTFEAPVKLFGIFPLRLFTNNILRTIGRQGMLFLSDEQLANFRAAFGNRTGGVIWPLPVDLSDFPETARNPVWGHLASIGRLSSMKEYNLYMPRVVRSLVDRGYDVRWTVYGDGPYHDRIKAIAEEQCVSDRIQLMGRWPHHRFSEALESAYVFVGMGTAMVEAALCGVPGPVAIAYDQEGATYGTIVELGFGNIGDRLAEDPPFSVEAEIEKILCLSSEGYAKTMVETRSAAERYDLRRQMPRFVEIAESARTKRRSLLHVALFNLFDLFSRCRRIFR